MLTNLLVLVLVLVLQFDKITSDIQITKIQSLENEQQEIQTVNR